VLQAVFIDLAGAPAPHVTEARETLAKLATAKSKPLIVIEVDAADPKAYRAALRQTGRRLQLQDCLLASAIPDHVRIARSDLAMTALRFRSTELEDLQHDFDDWLQLPLMIVKLLRAETTANLEHALRTYLAARYDLELTAIESGSTAEQVGFRATLWAPLEGDDLGEAVGVRAPFAVGGTACRRADGQVESIRISEPSAEELKEAADFVASLMHHGQLESHARGQPTRGTHQIVVDVHGDRRLVRARVGDR
jgi:hypothetical protein